MKAMTLSAATLMLLGTLTLGMAEDIATGMTVDEQITAIKNAPAQERVRLMNQFKVRLATMNEAEREAAITQLRTQTQTQTRTESGNADGEQIQTRTMTQERSRLNEMQQTQQMQQMQKMNQQQIRQQGTSGNNPAPNGRGH
jgi:small-conductance mechanosensitive channel